MAKSASFQGLSLVDALAQLSFLVQSVLGRLADEHELSIIQLRLLGILRDREPGMMELATLLELDKSSVTGLVDRAEKRGLVQRKSIKDDRRVVRVALTASGRGTVEAAAAKVEKELAAMTKQLTAGDAQKLVELIAKVLGGTATGAK